MEAGLHDGLREAVGGDALDCRIVVVERVGIAGAGKALRHLAMPGTQRRGRARGVAAAAIVFAEGAAYPIEKVVPVARRGKEIKGVEIVGQGCRSDGRAWIAVA